MKIKLFIIFLILFNFSYTHASPPYDGTIWYFPNTITSEDKSSLLKISYKNQQGREMFDRRVNDWIRNKTFNFDVTYDDNISIEFQVNSEFKNQQLALKEVEFYSYVIGQLPNILRSDVKTVWIHKGDKNFGGGNYNLLIHTDRAKNEYIPLGILEEVFIHEAVHTSLNWRHHKTSLTSNEKFNADLGSHKDWINAVKKDNNFLSKYAEQFPKREDMAESFGPYLAYKFRSDKIEKKDFEIIGKTIPNRIKFFDNQNFNLYPFN